MSPGKGSRRRPESEAGRYARGWEYIFGKKNPHRWLRGQAALDKLAEIRAYPSWVCHACAIKAGGVARRESTWCEGRCPVCGRMTAVTQPRDYGYPPF